MFPFTTKPVGQSSMFSGATPAAVNPVGDLAEVLDAGDVVETVESEEEDVLVTKK